MAKQKTKKKPKLTNLCNINEWKAFYNENIQNNKPKIPKILQTNSSSDQNAIENLKKILLDAAEASWEMEKKLIDKINVDKNTSYINYQFDKGNIASNINRSLDWSNVFGYLKNSNNDMFKYWKEVIKVVSSKTFIDDVSGAAIKKIEYLNEKTSDITPTAKSVSQRFKKYFIKADIVTNDYHLPSFSFEKEPELPDKMNEIIEKLQQSYINTLKKILTENHINDENEKYTNQIKNAVYDIYAKAYKRTLLVAKSKAHDDIKKITEEVTALIIKEGTIKAGDKEQYTYSRNKENRLIEERLFGPRNSYSREVKIDGSDITFLITGQGITLQIPEDIDGKASQLDTISTETTLDKKIFINNLVDIICKTIASHINLESTDNNADIYDPRFKNRLTSLLNTHFNNYKYDINKDKKKIGIYKSYLNSLFGEAGSENRGSTIQGTLGEFITASLLAIVIDGVQLTEEKLNNSDLQEDISAVYVNGQEVNKAGQQAHADIIVTIGTDRIGIQVKQYNSSDVNRNSQSFYKDDINIFGENSLRIDGLGRYFTRIGDDANIATKEASQYAQAAVKYLRELSLYNSNSENNIDVSEILYPHILRFARIQDDLEKGVEQSKKLTYNNFYVYNFALVPTSQILSQMIVNLDKELSNNKSVPSGLFTLKPIKAEDGSDYDFQSKEEEEAYPLILYRTKDSDYKRIEGPLNFVGLTVNPSKWYNFEGF